MKWCIKLDVVWERSTIIFQGHPSNFKVTQLKNCRFWPKLGRFQTVTPVWIHQWLLNDAQSLKCPIVFQGHPSNFKVTRDKISPILTRIECFRTVTPVWIYRWLWNMHKAWCDVEEVPYNFLSASIKFEGHTGWKIDNLNPFWVRLLGRSQLSNPSDLPCQTVFCCQF